MRRTLAVVGDRQKQRSFLFRIENLVPGGFSKRCGENDLGCENRSGRFDRRRSRDSFEFPQTDGAVPARRGEDGAVRAERDARDRRRGTGQFVQEPSVRSLPEANVAVFTGGGELKSLARRLAGVDSGDEE